MSREALIRIVDASSREADNLRRSSLMFESTVMAQANSDEIDTPSIYDTPIMDSFSALGRESLITMTNFMTTEFNILWEIREENVNERWYEGRGRRNACSAKDAMFMLLVVLKHFVTLDKHAIDFRLKAPTLEKVTMRILSIVEPLLTSELIRPPSMQVQRNADKLFPRFPEALYATDVKFQPAHRPTGTFMDAKRYFSGKHKLNGFKIEASVIYPGKYVLVSDHAPSSVSDLTMFMQRLDIHTSALKKSCDDIAQDEGVSQYPRQWAVLMDKGYEGVDDAVRSIRPKRPQEMVP
ncbi:Aste57867_6616 [Aphanomyces stellatus]|uniref:Aste57867_6616 protein n=1 Tax=Aphanomyces stellatus TaxID=120398 RepID=A0A485KHN8_9STRA|nr:hypothetical protein As57867_006598 [Aphanomyces stellatus]VFT83593.1 Aste57867_6616 [Aphanomyces stellatus]